MKTYLNIFASIITLILLSTWLAFGHTTDPENIDFEEADILVEIESGDDIILINNDSIEIIHSQSDEENIDLTVSISADEQEETLNKSTKDKDEENNIAGPALKTSFNLLLSDGYYNPNDMNILTPVIRSNTTADSLELSPIVIVGKLRDKVIKRNIALKNKSEMPGNAASVVLRENNTNQTIHYKKTVPYASWMENATLVVRNKQIGCASCDVKQTDLVLTAIQEKIVKEETAPEIAEIPQDTAKASYTPHYLLNSIVPEVEEVKNRGARHTASFSFVVNRYELLRDFKSNNQEFEKVDAVVKNIVHNPHNKITEFWVTGYASPEGKYESNKTLAHNRANAFAEYIESTFEISPELFKVNSIGEDWDGLMQAVLASDIADKDKIEEIVATTPNYDARDAKLMKLSGGATYRKMLNDFYPPLRRTEYAIAYVVRNFNIEEAKALIHTQPELLSLNEMYLVAMSYGKGSNEYHEIMKISQTTFPDSEIAVLNASNSMIQNKEYDQAIKIIEKTEYKDRLWNNLGIANALKGNKQRAMECFENAIKNNIPEGKHNKEELEKTEKD